jgi:hypothetical protein
VDLRATGSLKAALADERPRGIHAELLKMLLLKDLEGAGHGAPRFAALFDGSFVKRA